MKFNFENKESIPIIETSRVALYYRGKFLLLEKSKGSKNPGALEFPGGKIDEIKNQNSTIEEQMESAIREVEEETKIDIKDIPLEKIESYETYFEAKRKDGTTKRSKRIIHLFLAKLNDEKEYDLKVDQMKDENGKSEDNHQGYRWVTPEELVDSAVTLEKNEVTEKQFHPLSRNSRYIKKLLTTTGHIG